MDPTLKAIVELRDEMREFRTETRTTLGQHSHRLSLIGVTVSSLKSDAGALQGSVPALNDRLDNLETRVAALETRS